MMNNVVAGVYYERLNCSDEDILNFLGSVKNYDECFEDCVRDWAEEFGIDFFYDNKNGRAHIEWFVHNSEKVDDYIKEFGYSGDIDQDIKAALIYDIEQILLEKREQIFKTYAYDIFEERFAEMEIGEEFQLSYEEFDELEEFINNEATSLSDMQDYCNNLIDKVNKEWEACSNDFENMEDFHSNRINRR